jgi:hypothetical protein
MSSKRPAIVTKPRQVSPESAEAFVFNGPGQDNIERAATPAKAAPIAAESEFVTLNMRVSVAFRKEMKRLAYQHEIPMAEIVRQGVELWKAKNDK